MTSSSFPAYASLMVSTTASVASESQRAPARRAACGDERRMAASAHTSFLREAITAS